MAWQNSFRSLNGSGFYFSWLVWITGINSTGLKHTEAIKSSPIFKQFNIKGVNVITQNQSFFPPSWYLNYTLLQNQNPEVQINLALLYHHNVSENAAFPKGTATVVYCKFSSKNIRVLSSAGGGEMNDTDEEKDKERERARVRRNAGKGKGSKEAGLCVRLCVFMDSL